MGRIHTPLFSIIIPALNEEKFLPKLLASLSEQTERSFEVIVVDGQSSDTTVSAAKKFSKKLPALNILTANPRGLPRQRNLGAHAARGKWLIFSDADNVVMPYFLSRIKTFITEKSPIFFTGWCRSDSEVISDAIITLISLMTIEGSVSIKKPFSPGPLTIIRKDVFTAVGGYNETLVWGEDFEFSKRVCSSGYSLDVLRETIYIWSMRRFRKEGTINVLRKFSMALFYGLITNKALTKMPGYIMGGHVYTKQEKSGWSEKAKQFRIRFKRAIAEAFGG